VAFSSDGTRAHYTDWPDEDWHIALKSARLDGSDVHEWLSADQTS